MLSGTDHKVSLLRKKEILIANSLLSVKKIFTIGQNCFHGEDIGWRVAEDNVKMKEGCVVGFVKTGFRQFSIE